MTKFVFISDTHNRHDEIKVPECDVLVHSGDWSFKGHHSETESFAKWLEKQPAKRIVVVPGNHEVVFSKCLDGFESDLSSRTWITDWCPRANLLIHESVEIEGIKFFGSPWTPFFFNWAWNAGRTQKEADHVYKPFIGDLWKDIPGDTNVLVTHGPPYGILDHVIDWDDNVSLISVGCEELLKKVKTLDKLKIHAYGHLHRNGLQQVEINNVKFINAAICGDNYKIQGNPIVVEY